MRTQARPDIYTRVHKGLRKALFDLAYVAGRTDWNSDAEVAQLKNKLDEVMKFLLKHGELEDAYVLPLVEAKSPGASQHDTEDHHRIHAEVAAILAAIDDVAASANRNDDGALYYYRVCRFIADYLTHMDHEELVTSDILYNKCDDTELLGVVGQIMGGIAPDEMGMMLGYMIPAIDARERTGFLKIIGASAPPPVFQAVLGIAERSLSSDEWQTLNAEVAAV